MALQSSQQSIGIAWDNGTGTNRNTSVSVQNGLEKQRFGPAFLASSAGASDLNILPAVLRIRGDGCGSSERGCEEEYLEIHHHNCPFEW